MKRIAPGLLALALACPVPQARADDVLFRCGMIADATRRLACYDARVRELYQKSRTGQAAPRRPAPAPQPALAPHVAASPPATLNAGETSVAEIIAGFHELRGQMVTTPGILQVTVDSAALYAERTGALSVSINLAKLDGAARLEVLRNCAGGCAAAVTGRLTSAVQGPQILAAAVHLH